MKATLQRSELPGAPINVWKHVVGIIKAERVCQGLSQREMARRMNTSDTCYRDFELIPRNVQLSTLVNAADALGCELQIGLVPKRRAPLAAFGESKDGGQKSNYRQSR